MIKSIPHFFDIQSAEEITLELLNEYFDTNQYNEDLLDILLVDLTHLGSNTETDGTIFIESVEKGNGDTYHLNYLIPYFVFNGCKDLDISDDQQETVNFTVDESNIYFDIIETEKVMWPDEI
ncbi:TPA: hypothetical protein ACIR1F_004794 [Enterobacter roggenkampii]|uniref:hypothetical protein n=1 Tax=Enterobacter roggenkampii TaxID=1812935 RepID=UPI002005AE34|nr:hypothetical protein [Enterobacter roggenkampii]MCK6768796.1 hypothetical protein [Enterobacter roggenkampii]HCM9717259.1 hypothetical protein [Enterobacter kobei]